MQANLNAHLTDPLEELMEYLHVERDIWREHMYKVRRRSLSTVSWQCVWCCGLIHPSIRLFRKSSRA